MTGDQKYLAFGLFVLFSYWVVVSTGVSFFDDAGVDSESESVGYGGMRSRPASYGGGYQGGK